MGVWECGSLWEVYVNEGVWVYGCWFVDVDVRCGCVGGWMESGTVDVGCADVGL